MNTRNTRSTAKKKENTDNNNSNNKSNTKNNKSDNTNTNNTKTTTSKKKNNKEKDTNSNNNKEEIITNKENKANKSNKKINNKKDIKEEYKIDFSLNEEQSNNYLQNILLIINDINIKVNKYIDYNNNTDNTISSNSKNNSLKIHNDFNNTFLPYIDNLIHNIEKDYIYNYLNNFHYYQNSLDIIFTLYNTLNSLNTNTENSENNNNIKQILHTINSFLYKIITEVYVLYLEKIDYTIIKKDQVVKLNNSLSLNLNTNSNKNKKQINMIAIGSDEKISKFSTYKKNILEILLNKAIESYSKINYDNLDDISKVESLLDLVIHKYYFIKSVYFFESDLFTLVLRFLIKLISFINKYESYNDFDESVVNKYNQIRKDCIVKFIDLADMKIKSVEDRQLLGELSYVVSNNQYKMNSNSDISNENNDNNNNNNNNSNNNQNYMLIDDDLINNLNCEVDNVYDLVNELKEQEEKENKLNNNNNNNNNDMDIDSEVNKIIYDNSYSFSFINNNSKK